MSERELIQEAKQAADFFEGRQNPRWASLFLQLADTITRLEAEKADAYDKGLEDAAAECERMMMYPGGRQESAAHNNVWDAARAIRSLKKGKQ